MTESADRDPFFLEVDAILEVLKDAAAKGSLTPGVQPWERRHLEAVEHAAQQSAHWEAVIPRLVPFRKDALEYVARMLRARESQLARRGQLAFGSGRGNGMVGVALAALALITFWSNLKAWFPGISLVTLTFTFLSAASLIILWSWAVLSAVHGAGHLLFTAEMVDAAVKLKESGTLQEETPVPEAVPAGAVR